MFLIEIDPYRKQTADDFQRVLELLKLQAKWDQEDINAAYDKIAELEREKKGETL